ncbi:hypothetical protein ACWC1C_00630 [Streptomyces sp. NPDC001705]
MKTEHDALGWAAMLASIAVTAHGEWSLAVACGYANAVAAGLPIAIDAYAIRAMRAGREIFPPVLLMIATNAAAHLVHGGMLTVAPWLVVLVSGIAPVVLWRVHALRRHEQTAPEPAPADVPEQPAAQPKTESVPAAPEPVREAPRAVPDGVQLLPTFECRGELHRALRNERPALVPAAEYTRTRAEVHAEWTVPGDYADADGNPTEADDAPLTEYGLGLAAEEFKEELFAGKVPSIRAIKDRLSVGQNRAKEIQDGLRKALAAWQLAGTGATS